jgi:hypothetical protein
MIMIAANAAPMITCSTPHQSDLCSRLHRPLWTCLINDGRKVLG